MFRNKWLTPTTILGGISTVITYLGFLRGYFTLNDEGVVGVTFLGIIALWAFALALLNTRTYHSKVRYLDDLIRIKVEKVIYLFAIYGLKTI